MIRRPPRSTRTDTLCPYTTLFRSQLACGGQDAFRDRVNGGVIKELRSGWRDTGEFFVEPRIHLEDRSEEHTSELQSLMRSSYAVFCLKKKNNHKSDTHHEK